MIRRSNDVSQSNKFVPSPQVGSHKDSVYGTHHARDAALLFETLGHRLNFFSSAMMYVAENTAQPDKFRSIPETMWWSLITLTTVGYGDVSPLTPLGKIIGAVTAIMGVCVVALLTGIVANAFANQVARRKAILEAEVANALLDGEISDQEQEKIDSLRKRFDLSEDHVDAIIEVFKDAKK